MSRCRPVDRHTSDLLLPSIDDWLAERHLARLIVEVVGGLDLGELEKTYAEHGSSAYLRSMLLALRRC